MSPDEYREAAEAMDRELMELLGWAEWAEGGPGLDPIGASDMLSDLAQFFRNEYTHRMARGLTPQQWWEKFVASPIWEQYYPKEKE